jgi:D-3-phosphoglycerate dehydrogenase
MTWKVVMTLDLPAYADINEKRFTNIKAHFFKKQCNSEEEIIALAHDADAIITISLYQKITRKVIEQLLYCKIIANIGIGYEGIDVEAATEWGVCVANVADYCLDEVAEHAIALVLACARKLFPLYRLVREGKWTVERPEMRYQIYPTIHRLHTQTLGLIGFGRIPQTIVLKVRRLVSRILTYDPYVSPDVPVQMGVEVVELDFLLSQSDFVSVHANLTSETKGLIGMEQFKKMKPTAYLINTSRGPIVDQNALYTAISQGMIAGAALDVLDPEPPDPNDPLLQLNNVILTGHSAFASVEANLELHKRPVEEIIRLFHGEWPRNFVNPQVKDLYRAKHGKGIS